jgi:hypothetical protein
VQQQVLVQIPPAPNPASVKEVDHASHNLPADDDDTDDDMDFSPGGSNNEAQLSQGSVVARVQGVQDPS